jgi:hypothetical protein
MKLKDIAHYRLHFQQISKQKLDSPGAVVKCMGAVQAQDYLAALWAIGVRTKNADEADIEQALANGTLVRTWPLRGTLHIVAAEDVRWILEAFAPRVVALSANRLKRESDLDEKVFTKCKKIFERKLIGGKQLTRDELYTALETSRVSTAGQRGLHILWRLAHDGFICFGPRQGKQHTFVLLDEWVPSTKKISRDEALAKLAQRYFSSHGPATIHDFAWWSGVTGTDAKNAVESIRQDLTHQKVEGHLYLLPSGVPEIKKASNIYLLPSFDEYVISYTDRSAVLEIESHGKMVNTVNGIFFPIVIINGKVAGTWKRTFKQESIAIETKAFSSFSDKQKNQILKVAKQYAKFVGKKLAGKILFSDHT